jgi:pyridoxal phosphate enzyme (YggS family)
MASEAPAPGDVSERLALVRQEIALAAEAAGREPSSVKLVAVAKTVAPPVIAKAIAAGQLCFGENRVQEAQAKWPTLKEHHAGIELHLIGPLQTNKVREAVPLFDVIETVDRPKLARALAEEMMRAGKRPRLFVQVNTGEEPQKAGIVPGEAETFIAVCRETFGLTIDGLMCIPPVDEEPAMHFALLAKIAEKIGVKELSMGMSGDFARAIAFGATYVRIGTAIFGPRG